MTQAKLKVSGHNRIADHVESNGKPTIATFRAGKVGRSVVFSNGMEVCEEWITPQLAEAYARKVDPDYQRRFRANRGKRYAMSMDDGWVFTHQGIAFDTLGRLVDGLHRINACLLSGKPFRTLVYRALPTEAMRAIDGHLPRSVADRLQIEGTKVSGKDMSIAKRMMDGRNASNVIHTDDEIMDFIALHAEAIAFTNALFPSTIPKITVAAVMAPIARAYYTQSHERLKQYAEVLKTGMVKGEDDSAAVKLYRRMKDDTSSKKKQHVRLATSHIYGYAMNALRFFLLRQPVVNLTEATEEHFLLPEDVAAK